MEISPLCLSIFPRKSTGSVLTFFNLGRIPCSACTPFFGCFHSAQEIFPFVFVSVFHFLRKAFRASLVPFCIDLHYRGTWSFGLIQPDWIDTSDIFYFFTNLNNFRTPPPPFSSESKNMFFTHPKLFLKVLLVELSRKSMYIAKVIKE